MIVRMGPAVDGDGSRRIDRPVYLADGCDTASPAYFVWWVDLPDVVVVVHARRPGQAKVRALMEVREGYPEARYVEMRARRRSRSDAATTARHLNAKS